MARQGGAYRQRAGQAPERVSHTQPAAGASLAQRRQAIEQAAKAAKAGRAPSPRPSPTRGEGEKVIPGPSPIDGEAGGRARGRKKEE